MKDTGLCVSARWSAGALALNFRAAGNLDMPGLALSPGGEVALAISDERFCIGWSHPITGLPSSCPDQVVLKGSPQCEACAKREMMLPCHVCIGERCGNPSRRQECIQPDNHYCYLIALCPGVLKVGVARVERGPDRVAEQGARAAIFIGRADGKEIRNMEHHVKRLGYPDRLALSRKIDAWAEPAQNEALHQELERAHTEIRARLAGRWFKQPQRVEVPALAQIADSPRLLLHMAGARIRGKVLGVYGNAVVVASDAGETVAFEGNALIGYQMRRLAENESGQSQLALAL